MSTPMTSRPRRDLGSLAQRVAVTAVVAALVVVGLLLLWSVRHVLLTIVVGLFLAVGFEPVVRRLEAAGLRRGWAVLTLLVGLVVALAGFVWLALRPAVAQLNALLVAVPDLVAQLGDTDTSVGRFVADPQVSDAIDGALDSVPSYAVRSLSTVLDVLTSIAGTAFTTFTGLTLMIYFMLAMPRMLGFLRRLLGGGERADVLEEALGRVGGYVTGQLSVCVCAGVTSYAFFLVVGMPYAAVLAIAIGLVDAIPQVGATLGAVLAVVVALTVSVPVTIATAVFFLCYQLVENYLIAPRLFARAVNLTPVAVFVAVIVGASLGGVVGALLSLPVTAALKTVLAYVFRDRLAEIEAAGDVGDLPGGGGTDLMDTAGPTARDGDEPLEDPDDVRAGPPAPGVLPGR